MLPGWLHRFYLSVAEWCGPWYVHPLGERPEDKNPGRRCLTKRGAYRLRNEFDRAERDAVQPIEMERVEDQHTAWTRFSYPVETEWAVSVWTRPLPPAAQIMVADFTAQLHHDLAYGTGP